MLKQMEHIIKAGEFESMDDLYGALPEKTTYAKFKKTLNDLEKSNKIAYDKNGACR